MYISDDIINTIAAAIIDDIVDYINEHRDEYEAYLLQKEKGDK